MRMNVQFDGMKELTALLSRIPKHNIPAGVKQAVGTSALNIQRNAKKNCPVDTGALRNSIVADFYSNGMAAEVEARMPYAPFIEFGTRYSPAQPFLFPAFDQESPKFQEAVRQVLTDAFRKP